VIKKNILVDVEGVSKKFCKNLQWNLFYGTRDVVKVALGISLRSQRLRRHEFWALDDVSLQLYKEEILCILGNNGSGKTTLMRLISGIYPIDRGRIIINGKLVSLFSINVRMQPVFTGRENIYLQGGMYGMSREEIDSKINDIIEFSELESFIDAPFGTYSSGMRARLG
jgi:lipopolysaccharide transport system ATP-binding protein